MKIRKRQLILASLVLALGTAVYLNWQLSENKGLEVSNVLESTSELGEARYVNTSNFSEKQDTPKAPSTNVSEETKKYFAEAQIARQKAHDEAQEKLKNLISNSNITQESKEEISRSLEMISKSIKQESDIENLIKAKGFSECLVSINNEGCTIVVNPGSLNENSVVIIRDAVTGQSDIPANKIKITEAK